MIDVIAYVQLVALNMYPASHILTLQAFELVLAERLT